MYTIINVKLDCCNNLLLRCSIIQKIYTKQYFKKKAHPKQN